MLQNLWVNVTRTNVTEPKKIWDSMQKSKILSGDASLLISDTKIVVILAIGESSLSNKGKLLQNL